jgi:hypothetical protein
MSRVPRVYDAPPGRDADLAAALGARPFFRLVTDEEVTRSYEAYRSGSPAHLVDEWARVAEPTRAALGAYGPFYRRARLLPSEWNGLAFVASLRAVLTAGQAFRKTLQTQTQRALAIEFPWLEHRHEHVPPGWTPPLAFPAELARFLEAGDLDDARARWQLLAALNEVQQCHYSASLVTTFGLPELGEHAARERALALNYLAHWSPAATPALFRQCLIVLDALNATVFEMMCRAHPRQMILHSVFGRRAEWRAFVAGLKTPQRLVPPRARDVLSSRR